MASQIKFKFRHTEVLAGQTFEAQYQKKGAARLG